MAWGLEYDASNPKSFWSNVLGLVLLVLSWLAVIARFWARFHINSLGLDDYLILPAQILYNVFVVMFFGLHHYTPGSWPKTIDDAIKGSNFLIGAQASTGFCVLFFKLSLGAFFLRICVQKQQRKLLYGTMILSTIINITVAFFAIFCCGNPKGYLLKFRFDKCVPRSSIHAVGYLQCIVNAIVDIIFVAIPFLLLRSSNLPKKMKIYVYGILFLATIGCVASIVRVAYINALFNFDDFYRSIPPLAIVTHVELGSGIIASSLATLRPLLKAIVQAIGSFRPSQFYASAERYQPPGATVVSDKAFNQNAISKDMNSVKMPRYIGEDEEDSDGVSFHYGHETATKSIG